MTVVLVRSNSFTSGRTSDERERSRSGVPSAEMVRDAQLVVRVRVGVEEADCDGGDAVLEQRVGRSHEALRVEGANHVAPKVDAFGDLLPEVAGDERWRLVPVHVVEARVPEAADLEHVAEARPS